MNQPFDSTIDYYDAHADEYARDTVNLELESLYAPFLALVPAGGTILDAGCGSGRDSRMFKDRGFKVTAIDASERMAAVASQFLAQQVGVMRLQDIRYDSEFNGIWACASALHVPRAEIDGVLKRFWRALKPGGVCFLSFKEGTHERLDGERYFTDFTSSLLAEALAAQRGVVIVRIWTSADTRGRPDVRWVNAILKKMIGELEERQRRNEEKLG